MSICSFCTTLVIETCGQTVVQTTDKVDNLHKWEAENLEDQIKT